MKKQFILALFSLLCAIPLRATNTYKTAFPLTENPISESSAWTNGGTTGLDWSNCKTNGTSILSAQTSFGGFNDATCVLTNVTWGTNQIVTAKVAAFTANEIELRLRTTISAHSITGYEVLFSVGQEQIVRWDGTIGTFTVLQTNATVGIKTGDEIRAIVSGSTITAYINGVQVGAFTDSNYTTGSPGVGFFCTASCTLTQEELTNFVATDGTLTFPQFSNSVGSCYGSVTTGATIACTLGSAPVIGQFVAVSVQTFPVRSLSTVKDNAGTPNSYSITPNSCSIAKESTAGNACVAYWIPTGTGGTIVTATVTGGNCTACSITVDVFNVLDLGGGTITFDTDTKGLGGSGTVNTPSATPAQSGWPNDAGELFWGFCTNATACNGATGSWVLESGGTSRSFGEDSEYQIHVTASTAVGFAGTASNDYDSMIMAIKVTQPAAGHPGGHAIVF